MIKNINKNIFVFSIVSILFGQSPDQVLNDGRAQLANGDYEQAEVLFKKALGMDPTFSPAMLELARINLRFGKMKNTQEFLRQAIDIDPENQEYRDEFDRINEINTLMSDASRYMSNSDFDNAFESYRIVLEKFPFFSEAAFSKGLVRYREKKLDEAVIHFKKALEINPYHEKARTAMDNVTKKAFNDGNRSYKRGDLDGAIESYQKVLDFDDSFYQAHYQIGVIKAKMGDRDRAIEHYESSLSINPDFYKGWFALGLSKKSNGDNMGAISAFNSAVEVYPAYDKAYGAMGEIYFNEKNYEKAIEVLNTSVQVNPNYSKGYSTLGVVYIEMEEWGNAVNNLVLATTYNEKDAMSWYRLSSAYNKLGDCENAQEAARNATDYKKNFGGAWVELGISVWCNGKGNKIAAVNALEKGRKDRSWRKIAEYEMDKIMNPQKYQD